MIPARLVRRLVLAPGVVLLTFLAFTTLPLWMIGAALATAFVPGRWRPLRLLWVALVYLVCESIGILACFALWIASGFGATTRTKRMQDAHYNLMRWFIETVYRAALPVLKLSVDVDHVEEAGASPESSNRPLLVLSRHAGPGDSFLVVYEVLVRLQRRPRIVLKDALQWDPCMDIVLNRLPNRFISPNPGSTGDQVVAAIGDLAEGMDERDALVIFPEGGNFTPRRRMRAIERLKRLRHHDEAEVAERMTNVMAPRPGGALAAIEATPETDILFVAHTGLEHMSTIADLWAGLPMDQSVLIGWWTIAEESLPNDRDEQVSWLFRHWEDVDGWIERNKRPTPRTWRRAVG
ncbi:MAG: 1-acyl-sn-glycerol-3-phosphate acyltransferase [Actinomycetota bacterium]